MRNTNLMILFFTLTVVMLGFGIIIPIIPFYVTQYGAGGAQLGLLMAVFSLMQFFFAPVWGSLSDRYGRKKLLMLGAFGNALSHLIFGLSNSLAMMFVARALAGMLSSATLPSALAYITDNTDEKSRGGGMGLIGAAMGTGMVLGPGIGGWLGIKSLSAPFILASALSLTAVFLIFFILPESHPEANRQHSRKPALPNLTVLWQALRGPLGFLLFLAFLVNFALANFEGIFGLYAKDRYGYGPDEVGSILTIIGIISVLVQALVTGRATRKIGEANVIKLSLFASAVGFGLMLLAREYGVVLLTVGFFVFSNAMLRPSIASLISKRATEGFGIALGLSSSFESLGRVVGPLYAGSMLDVNLSLPYLSAAFIMLAAFFLAIFKLKGRDIPRAMPASERLPD